MMKTIETTEAKIGRSMKKREMGMGCPASVRIDVAGRLTATCDDLALDDLAPAAGAPFAGAGACHFGVTFWPGRTRASPLTTT